ncbi:MAG: DUF72 domain-containing protein [Deltaproteobacteria bacterium]|nr:MAG: DUF72 domain-containing protein [Deltaproteobacteria bacterium]
MIKVGCCGFPVGRRVYYESFDCVEVQQTFYHPPRIETLRKWRDEAPQGFEFTLKAWQLITHTPKSPTYRRLKMRIPEEKAPLYGNFLPSDEVFSAWEVTREAAEALGARIVVFQTPSSFRPTPENLGNMREFFRGVERGGMIFGWEPRGWEGERVAEICEELDLLHIVDPFQGPSLWGELTYWRLHGKGGYRYRYTDDDLALLEGWIPGGKRVYVMFNNTSMFQDAQRFIRLLEERSGAS